MEPRPATALPAPARASRLVLADDRVLWLRPIRADDVAAMQRGFARLTPEQVRLRVFHSMNELSREAAERLCHIDPASQVAFVAVDADGEIRGDARFYTARGSTSAEFAIVIDPGLTGMGVGSALMRKLLVQARKRQLDEVWGMVLTENTGMLELARFLGAERQPVEGEPQFVRVRFHLGRRRKR